jgi:hypothetical protein
MDRRKDRHKYFMATTKDRTPLSHEIGDAARLHFLHTQAHTHRDYVSKHRRYSRKERKV